MTNPTPMTQRHEDAVVAKLAAETSKLEAEALREVNLAFMAGLNREERERHARYSSVADHFQHHYLLQAGIKEETVAPLLQTMSAWNRLDQTAPWHITINSPGGHVTEGMHLFDELTAYSLRGNIGGQHEITMKVRGRAASMGAILLQAADIRVMGPQSYLLVHQVSAGTSGRMNEMKDDVKWYEHVCDKIAKIFVERSNGGITMRAFNQKWAGRDWWLDAQESLKLGFIDRIG